MASSKSVERLVASGEVFTRRWVVELILDLAGYSPDKDLGSLRTVEPACGTGAFLGPIVERLSASFKTNGQTLDGSVNALRAYDLLESNVEQSRRVVIQTLVDDDWDKDDATDFAKQTVIQGDYLLKPSELRSTDFVLGNPPYIRLEDIPRDRTAAYRAACPTMGGRADVYVGFIEQGLRSLRDGGVLGFIVADRWMHNAYGARLRAYVASNFSVDVTIQMHDVDAFEEQVSAYPAISIMRRAKQGRSIIADASKRFAEPDTHKVSKWVTGPKRKSVKNDRYEIDVLPHWFDGSTLWPSGSPATVRLMEELNDRFHPIEDPSTSTRVGIGVATGADQVFVTKDPDAVEPERMLPLSMAFDTNSGTLEWSGHYLVNPWQANKVVELSDWPRLRSYMEEHAQALRRRNIATKNETRWYRTIDRVTDGLESVPKLLFPDMRMTSRPVYDPGGLYPHHNLYYVVSEDWDLKVLGGLMFSRIVEATVEAYCVKMRGGTLRFQAQYLRQIRLPRPDDIGKADAKALARAFEDRDAQAATKAALRVYDLKTDLESTLDLR